MPDLISRDKLLRDLGGMYDVLLGHGDPFLASVMHRAIQCVESQPSVPAAVAGKEE